MKNDTSASRGVFCSGRCQRRSTWDTMFWRYSGNGNSTPSVLTVATSLPVDGVSPGSGGFWGVVRGAASRRLASGGGGGPAPRTPRLGGAQVPAGGPLAADHGAEGGAEVLVRQRGLIEENPAALIHGDDEARFGLERPRFGARQAHVNPALHDRRGDHEDDEQHERHVHE